MHPPRSVALSTVLTLALGVLVAAGPAVASATRTAAAPSSVRLVAGTHAVRDSTGRLWTPDSAAATGGRMTTTARHVAGTSHPGLYRAARYGAFGYRLAVVPGSYRVSVNVADYTNRSAGKRVFAVIADGRTVAAHIDAAAAVGRLHAFHVHFTVPAPSGAVVLRFVPQHGEAAVSNVELTRVGGVTVPAYVTPEQFGARGDGHADDSAALQAAFDAATPAIGVWLAPGRTYAHSRVLDLRVAGAHVTGGGTLLATDERSSSVWADADDVVLDGITVAIAATTRRGETWDQMGVRIVGHSGVVLRDVTVDGSAAAGIYVGNGATRFLLDHVTVRNSNADGIHMTGGANNGRVVSPLVAGSGDDGVAVVSYAQDGAPCHDIVVSSPRVRGTTWGRGISVVGGTNITETDIDVQRSDAAGIYIGTEGDPWNTTPATDVSIVGGSISNANTDAKVDHGAVFVLAGRSGSVSRGITVTGLTISNTRSTASRDLGVVTYGSSPPVGVVFSNLVITGGPRDAYSGNTAQSSYRLRNITQNGVRLPDRG